MSPRRKIDAEEPELYTAPPPKRRNRHGGGDFRSSRALPVY